MSRNESAEEQRQRPGDAHRHADEQGGAGQAATATRQRPGSTADDEGKADADPRHPDEQRADGADRVRVEDEAAAVIGIPTINPATEARRLGRDRASRLAIPSRPKPAKWKCVAVRRTITGENPV